MAKKFEWKFPEMEIPGNFREISEARKEPFPIFQEPFSKCGSCMPGKLASAGDVPEQRPGEFVILTKNVIFIMV